MVGEWPRWETIREKEMEPELLLYLLAVYRRETSI